MPQAVLIRTPNHLGDCLMALPMINETREAYPGSSITLMVPEKLADIYKNNPAIDDMILVPPKYMHGLVAVTKFKDLLGGKKYDIGYILPPSFGAASGFKLAGVKERIGYIVDGRRLLLTKPLPLPTPLSSEHRSVLYFNLLRRGAGIEIDYVKPKLMLNDDDSERAVSILTDFGVAKEDNFVAVAFQAVAESRRWGVDNYISLIKQIKIQLGLKTVLVGGAEDQKLGEEIVESTGSEGVINLAGKTSLRETASVLSFAKLFVGNDSGPAHLSAAVGIPVVVISGADEPASTSPQAANKILIFEDSLDCISCVKNKCPLKGDDYMRCMKNISVEKIFNAVELLL